MHQHNTCNWIENLRIRNLFKPWLRNNDKTLKTMQIMQIIINNKVLDGKTKPQLAALRNWSKLVIRSNSDARKNQGRLSRVSQRQEQTDAERRLVVNLLLMPKTQLLVSFQQSPPLLSRHILRKILSQMNMKLKLPEIVRKLRLKIIVITLHNVQKFKWNVLNCSSNKL